MSETITKGKRKLARESLMKSVNEAWRKRRQAQPPTEPRAPRITYACPNCGQVDSHADDCPSNPRAQTATPWMVAPDGSGLISEPEADSDIRHSVAQVHGNTQQQLQRRANYIVHRVNQHTKLVAALRSTVTALGEIINASENEPFTSEELVRLFNGVQGDARNVLEAALANEPEGSE